MDQIHPAELKTVREQLGLSDAALAAALGVAARTVRAWEEGRHPVPGGVRTDLEALTAEADKFVAEHAQAVAAQAEPVFATYRSDAEYPRTDLPHTASWHRAAAARIARAVPGCRLVYAGDPVRLPEISETGWRQLADVLHGTYIDAAARQDPRRFLAGEIEDCLDELTDACAYPELLAEARGWTRGQSTGVLAEYAARYRRNAGGA